MFLWCFGSIFIFGGPFYCGFGSLSSMFVALMIHIMITVRIHVFFYSSSLCVCVCVNVLSNIQREALSLWTIWSLFFKLKACAFFLALFNLVAWKSPMQLVIIFSRNLLISCSNICRLKSERWVMSGGETQLQKYKVGSDCCWFSAQFEVFFVSLFTETCSSLISVKTDVLPGRRLGYFIDVSLQTLVLFDKIYLC